MKHNTTQKNTFSEGSHETDPKGVRSQLAELPASVTRAMWKDFFQAALKKTVPEQVTGKEAKAKESAFSTSGELTEGQEISLQAQQDQEPVISMEHREYFRREVVTAENRSDQKEQYEVRERLEMLKIEVRKLIKAQKEMESAFKEVSNQVTVETTPQEVGKYHLNFLEWVLIVVRNARMRVEEGQTWMSTMSSKKQQKQYWNQAKKHGTSFTLNNERTAATQTG